MDHTAGDQNETVLQELRQRDNQVRQLLEQKKFYEEVLSELCEEAGLFELDQNVVIWNINWYIIILLLLLIHRIYP